MPQSYSDTLNEVRPVIVGWIQEAMSAPILMPIDNDTLPTFTTTVSRTFGWHLAGTVTSGTQLGPTYTLDAVSDFTRVMLYAKTTPTTAFECDIQFSVNGGTTWTSAFVAHPTIQPGFHQGGFAVANVSWDIGTLIRMDVISPGGAVDVTIQIQLASTFPVVQLAPDT